MQENDHKEVCRVDSSAPQKEKTSVSWKGVEKSTTVPLRDPLMRRAASALKGAYADAITNERNRKYGSDGKSKKDSLQDVKVQENSGFSGSSTTGDKKSAGAVGIGTTEDEKRSAGTVGSGASGGDKKKAGTVGNGAIGEKQEKAGGIGAENRQESDGTGAWASGVRKAFPGVFSRRNQAYNARFTQVTSYIGCQGDGGEADALRFGLFRMAFNGCEVIAVYNVLKYLGAYRDVRRIAADFEAKGAILFGGFGTRPDVMREYLAKALRAMWISANPGAPEEAERASCAVPGVQLYGRGEAVAYERIFSGCRAGILTFWNGPGKWTIHTVALFPLKNGRIRAFNRYNNTLFQDYDSIGALLAEVGGLSAAVSLITVG